MQCPLLVIMYHVLLDVVAVYSLVSSIQKLNLVSSRKSTVKNLEMSVMNASFDSGNLTCHMLIILEQYIWLVITILSICTRLRVGPTSDLDTW